MARSIADWNTSELDRHVKHMLGTEFGVVPLHRVLGDLTALSLVQRDAAPPAPAKKGAVLYSIDNGAGKTALMVQFATGAPVQVAVEP